MDEKEESKPLKANYPFLMLYTFTVGIGMWQTSIALAGVATTMPIIAMKLDWEKNEIVKYSTIITSAGIVGMSCGSLLAGKLIANGRRRGALIMCAIALIGGIFQQFLTIPTLLIGRIMQGFAAGTLSVVMVKSIAETVPSEE